MKSVLIVDPDERYLDKISEMFVEGIEEVEIMTASTFKEASIYIQTRHFDIITLDETLEKIDDPMLYGVILPEKKIPTYKGRDLIPSIREHQDLYCKVVMICKKITEIREGISQGADIGYRKKDLLWHIFDENLKLQEADE